MSEVSKVTPSTRAGYAQLTSTNREGLSTFTSATPNTRFLKPDTIAFPLTASAVRRAAALFPQAVWEGYARQRLCEVKKLDLMRATGESVHPIAHTARSSLTGADGTKPQFQHQTTAVGRAYDKDYFAFIMEQGTGKTKTALDLATLYRGEKRLDTILVVAPKGVHRKWAEQEAPTHFPPFVDFTALFWQGSANKKFQAEIMKVFASEKLVLVAVNIEALQMQGEAYNLCQAALRRGNSMFIVDESSRIKTPSASRTKNVLALSKLAKFRLILSGTPVVKNVADIYSQYKFLSPDILGFSTVTSFQNTFCEMGGFKNKQVVGGRNLEKLAALTSPFTYSVKKADCLDLPPKVYDELPLSASAAVKKLIKELEEGVQETDGAIGAQASLFSFMRAACGHKATEQNPESLGVRVCDERLVAAIDAASDVDGPVVIWANFRRDLIDLSDAAEKAFGKGAVAAYWGAVKDADRAAAIRDFQAGRLKALIANPASAGIGLDMTASSYAIYYSNSYNAEHRWQSEDRLHRIGQVGKSVTYLDTIVRGTLDREILRNLRDKKSLADLVTDGKALKAFLRKAAGEE